MSDHATARRRARSRILAVGVAAVTALLMAAPMVQPVGATTGLAAVSARADRVSSAAAASAPISDQIQKMLLKFAAQKLAGFALNKLGLDKLLSDSDGMQLEELKAQLTKVSEQITILQASADQISKDLSELRLEGFTIALGDTITKITSLYTDFYRPTLNALTTYVTLDLAAQKGGESCPLPAPPPATNSACSDARGHFDTLRRDFLKQFTAEGPASYNIQIHNRLMPGLVGDSAMTAYGLYLARHGNGLLNSDTSSAVLDFYNYFADYEALASWMKAQWNGSEDRFFADPAEFDRFLQEQIYDYQDQEHKALPPPIPANTVIALPANASLRTNDTRNLPMWGAPTDASFSSNPVLWDSYSIVGQLQPNVPDALAFMNVYGPVKGWSVPSRAELDALLSRGPADKNAKDFLLSLNNNWPQSFQRALAFTPTYIWTTQGAGIPSWKNSPAITCENFNGASYVPVATFTDYLHTAVGPVTNSLSGYPAQYQNYSRPNLGIGKIQTNLKPPSTVQDIINACKAILKDDVVKAWNSNPVNFYGTLLATRNTGDVNYLP